MFNNFLRSKTGKVILILAAIYVLSAAIRFLFPPVEKLHVNQKVDVVTIDNSQVSFSYLEFGSENSRPTILIIPDPFSHLNELEPFANQLSENWKVIIPDFSKTNKNGSNIGYSADSRAEIVAAWFNERGESSVHLAGNGFGNTIAIELMVSEIGDLIQSYTLLSALGVQEFHFLGYHLLNQPVYSLLYPIGIMVEYGLPIAGWQKQSIVDMERVRFINEKDQRPYRDILSSIQVPVLIMHGAADNHVSTETAREHYRIIPQSELIFFDGNKHSIFFYYDKWAANYIDFLSKVDRGGAITKADAAPKRIELAERDFTFGDVPPVYGWGLVLILFLLSVVTLVSEDLGCIGGGLLVAGGVIPFWIAFLVIYVGIVVADTGIYWVGRKLGRPVVYKAPIRWIISRRDVDWSAEMFHTNGFKIIFASRFLPGTRFPTYFTAGLLKIKFSLFLFYFFIAITIWTPLLLGISIFAGQHLLVYLQIYQDYAFYLFIGLVIGLYLLFKFIMPLATKKGRREFAVRIIRLRQRITREYTSY